MFLVPCAPNAHLRCSDAVARAVLSSVPLERTSHATRTADLTQAVDTTASTTAPSVFVGVRRGERQRTWWTGVVAVLESKPRIRRLTQSADGAPEFRRERTGESLARVMFQALPDSVNSVHLVENPPGASGHLRSLSYKKEQRREELPCRRCRLSYVLELFLALLHTDRKRDAWAIARLMRNV